MFFKSKAFVMLAAVLALGGCKKESGAGDAAQVPTVAAVKVEPQNIPLSFELQPEHKVLKKPRFAPGSAAFF